MLGEWGVCDVLYHKRVPIKSGTGLLKVKTMTSRIPNFICLYCFTDDINQGVYHVG